MTLFYSAISMFLCQPGICQFTSMNFQTIRDRFPWCFPGGKTTPRSHPAKVMKTCIFPLSQTVPTGVLRQGVNFANTSTSLTPHLALCPSYMRSINLLTKVMMLRMFSLTSRKHLTKFGTTVIIFKLTENGISGNLPKP